MRLPNGYGSVYKLSGNRRRPWIARVTTGWSDERKQLYYTVGYFETRAKAMAALAEYNENPIGEVRDATLGELYKTWSTTAYETLSRSQANVYRAAWRRLEHLGSEPIRNIKTSHLQKAVDAMKGKVGRSSMEKTKTLAGILFELAKNDDVIATNYARAIKLPPSRKPKRDVFTDLEIQEITKAATDGDTWAGTILILIYSGMRPGEMLKLTRFSVDMEEWFFTGGIKTDKGKDRIVPIHSKIRPYVSHWYNTKSAKCLIHRDGDAISVDYYRKDIFYPTLDRIGIKRKITPRAARHTFGTLLDKAKANTKHIQDLMGHTDYAVTANIYTHPHLDELRDAIEAI